MGNPQLVVMDEPTSSITEKETEHLFRIIRDLKSRGVAIIYISHKMHEIFQIADEISVMRDGRLIVLGPDVVNRAQARSSVRLLFNALFYGPATTAKTEQ